MMLLAATAAAAFVVPASADPPVSPVSQVSAARSQATATVSAIETTARHARRLLQWAREGGTPRQIACADEGLSRSDVALRSAREHARAVEEAGARGDAALVRRELVLIAACREAARAAASASEACLGHADDTVVHVVAAPTSPPRAPPR